MSASAQLAREKKVLLHTHLAETSDENSFCENLYGCRPLDYLEKVGWLSSNVWLAHGIHFSSEEIQRLGRSKTGICHCPSSNMTLESLLIQQNELLSNTPAIQKELLDKATVDKQEFGCRNFLNVTHWLLPKS